MPITEVTFEEMYAAARHRMLTRFAEQAATSAQEIRDQIPRFPGEADGLEERARACDDYAAACRAAADDLDLPLPAGPNYPDEQEN